MPDELIRGDPLIRANRRLAEAADGVYRRGEIYLRWLQRFSSLFFGTWIGRLLTLYLAVPFGGAFLVLEGLQHVLVDPLWHLFGPVHLRLEPLAASAVGLAVAPEMGGGLLTVSTWYALDRHPPHLLNRWSLPLLGLFFLGLLYRPAFRRRVGDGFLFLGRVLRWPIWDVPSAVLTLPLVERFLQSWSYFLLAQYLLKPLLWTLLLLLVPYLCGVTAGTLALTGVCLFASILLLLVSRLGVYLEEVTTDGLARWWGLLRSNVLPDLFRWVVFIFRVFQERVEKLLYTVDEWLRFQSGESRLSLGIKAVLGVFWWLITYVLRFAVNLLIEPQINPIKHFPVVTVSHKLVITLGVPPLAHLLENALQMRQVDAFALAGAIGFMIPGIFGFLAWELKENWRLYRANQSPTLDPVLVGHHGETVPQLMRPGFHSGTLPKLFARLRKNLRHGKGQSARKQQEALAEVSESLHHFVERSLLALLAASRDWGPSLSLTLEQIRLATRRITLELSCRGLAEERLILLLDQHGGLLAAGFAQAGFLGQATPEQRQTFLDALAGFYKLAGVNLVREQIAAHLPQLGEYLITANGLVPLANPQQTIPLQGLEFSATPITWKDWVETWERDRHGKGHETPLLADFASSFRTLGVSSAQR